MRGMKIQFLLVVMSMVILVLPGNSQGFNPNANESVISIAVQADGKILLGGYFNTIGGVTVIDHPNGATHDRVKGATAKGPFWVSDRASV